MNTDSRSGAPPAAPVAVDWSRAERLAWVQPRLLSRGWILQADGEPVATLDARGFWHRSYTAHTHAGRWNIVEPWWGPTRLTREGETSAEIEARTRWPWSHDLVRAAGEPLVWRRRGWTNLSHTLETREQFPILRVRERLSIARALSEVELMEAARGLPDLEPLLLIAWVLQLRSHRARTR